METLNISPYIIAALFFVVAFAYSSVGLGGGSSYTALLAIFGVNALAIPMISLMLNLIVTTVGSFNFIRKRHARLRLILPFLITSMPMAYLGGSLELPQELFYWLLLISLVVVVIRIYAWNDSAFNLNLTKKGEMMVSLLAGVALGLLSGIVGIGGGIYLVPIIIMLGLGTDKEAAACGAIFIWLNSLSGLISRHQYNAIDLKNYLPIIIAVLVGGALGSYMGASRLSSRVMEKILGLVIIVAIFFLLRKVLSL